MLTRPTTKTVVIFSQKFIWDAKSLTYHYTTLVFSNATSRDTKYLLTAQDFHWNNRSLRFFASSQPRENFTRHPHPNQSYNENIITNQRSLTTMYYHDQQEGYDWSRNHLLIPLSPTYPTTKGHWSWTIQLIWNHPLFSFKRYYKPMITWIKTKSNVQHCPASQLLVIFPNAAWVTIPSNGQSLFHQYPKIWSHQFNGSLVTIYHNYNVSSYSIKDKNHYVN